MSCSMDSSFLGEIDVGERRVTGGESPTTRGMLAPWARQFPVFPIGIRPTSRQMECV